MSMNLSKFFELVKGKTVCVVGGARTVDLSMVHSADIVITTNNHGNELQFIEGQRQVVFFASAESILINPNILMYALDESGRNFANNLRDASSICEVITYSTEIKRTPVDPFEMFCRHLMTKPLTGIFAVYACVMAGVDDLSITGFDFYEREGVIPLQVYSHRIGPQFNWLSDLVRYNASSVRVDAKLKEILRQPEMKPFPSIYKIVQQEDNFIFKVE